MHFNEVNHVFHTFSLRFCLEIEVSIEMKSLWQRMLVSGSLNAFSLNLTAFSISFSQGLPSKLRFQLILRAHRKLMAVNGCFHKPEYIFYEVNHIFHKLRFQLILHHMESLWKRIVVSISLNIFVMKLAMLSVRFS